MRNKGDNRNIDWKLVSRKLESNISKEEEKEFTIWLNASLKHRHFFNKAKINDTTDPGIGLEEDLLELKKEELLFKICNKSRRTISFTKILKYAVIITIPLLLTIGFLWVSSNNTNDTILSDNNILPGESKAVLILNDGTKINIDSLPKVLVEKDGSNIQAKEDKLVYASADVQELIYNELIIPQGAEYKLQLSDGTKVWLNSASKLRYPVSFDNEKREVYLEGEAYFEVEKDKKRPFRVFCNDVEVKVYGTSFNVNSHNIDKIQTVLVEGSVGIRVGKNIEKKLKPNQLAEYSINTKEISISNVDVSKYIAWRYGEFVFEEETIKDIMDRLALWYDVEVFYQNKELENIHFTGSMKRYDNIENLLRFIEQTGNISFRVKGRSVTVYKK